MAAGSVTNVAFGLTPAELWAVSDPALPELTQRRLEALLAAGTQAPAPALEAAAGQGRGGGSAVAEMFIANLLVQHSSLATMWGLATSADLVQQRLLGLGANPDVGAIVLRFHSPGGYVHGIPQLAAAIRAVRKQKPVIGHADSMATSGAYWLLASCSEAWASPLADLASIGVFTVHTSTAEADKLNGITRTLIALPEAKGSEQDLLPLSAEARQRIEARALAAYAQFVGDVAKGRGVSVETVRSEEWGRGAQLDVSAALKAKMVDGVRSYRETLAAVAAGRYLDTKGRLAAAGDSEELLPALAPELVGATRESGAVPLDVLRAQLGLA